jgi:hypothetical protein
MCHPPQNADGNSAMALETASGKCSPRSERIVARSEKGRSGFLLRVGIMSIGRLTLRWNGPIVTG